MKRRFNEKQMEIINNTINTINAKSDDYIVSYQYDDYAKHHAIILEPKTSEDFICGFKGIQPYNYDCCIGYLMGLETLIQ